MILAAPTQRPISSIVTRIGAWLPRGWGDLARQLAIFALFDLFYEATRTLAVGDRAVALRHANDIVSAERSLGIFHELDVQHFAATSPHFVQAVANWTYFNCQFTISFGFLFWVYLRRNHAFPLVRNVFIVANAIGLACYTLYPAAPPRMLGSLGFVDTLNETSVNHHSGLIASLSNPYAAMPSLHTAYALIVGTSAVMLVRTRVLRVLWAFYPALVVFSIVATANHFFLDAAGGAGVAMLAALAVYAAHTRSRRLAAVLVAAPVASFLVYRFAGRAGQAADTLAAVALGTLALAMAANLVSVWLKAAVWRRTLDAVDDAPRLTTRDLLPSVFIGFLFNTVLVARLGELVRVAVLTRRIRRTGSQLPVTAVAGTLVAEQLVLGAALAADRRGSGADDRRPARVGRLDADGSRCPDRWRRDRRDPRQAHTADPSLSAHAPGGPGTRAAPQPADHARSPAPGRGAGSGCRLVGGADRRHLLDARRVRPAPYDHLGLGRVHGLHAGRRGAADARERGRLPACGGGRAGLVVRDLGRLRCRVCDRPAGHRGAARCRNRGTVPVGRGRLLHRAAPSRSGCSAVTPCEADDRQLAYAA